MKSHTKVLSFHTRRQRELSNITQEVKDALAASGVAEGLVLVSALHATSAVFVNDDEPGLQQDIAAWLQEVAPAGPDYLHHRTGETNGDAHLRNLLLGHQVIVPVTEGELDLGPWQRVFYYELDGQRPKRVVVKVLGE